MVVTTPIAHTDHPLSVIETATATETERGTETAIAIEGWIHPVAADDTTNLIRTTTVDTPLPRVATSGVQTNTDPVATAMVHAKENAPRDTKTMITAMDLPLVDTDLPARSTVVMRMMKIQKSVGDVDARGGIVGGIGIAIGRNTTIRRINRLASTTRPQCVREVITEAILEATSTMLQVCTIANTDLGTTMTRCPFRIIL